MTLPNKNFEFSVEKPVFWYISTWEVEADGTFHSKAPFLSCRIFAQNWQFEFNQIPEAARDRPLLVEEMRRYATINHFLTIHLRYASCVIEIRRTAGEEAEEVVGSA